MEVPTSKIKRQLTAARRIPSVAIFSFILQTLDIALGSDQLP